MPVGLHLIIDAECSRGLNDARSCNAFLHQAARLAGMEVIGAQVHKLPTGVPTGPGVTAMIVLTTSHSSLHSFPEANRLSFDFFSCQEFDDEPILKLFEETFGVTKYLALHRIERAEMMDG